jgi:hypothetical protein
MEPAKLDASPHLSSHPQSPEHLKESYGLHGKDVALGALEDLFD